MSADDLLYAYDPTGKITSVTHPNESGSTRDVVYTYDRLHRVLSEKSSGVVQDYTYDKAGNRLSANYGGTGRQLTYGYDALNRQTVIADNEEDDATAFGYDLNGSVVERAFGSGLSEVRSHDARNRLTYLRHLKTAVETGRYDYQYDRVGNVREIEESYPGGLLDDRTITNSYDGTYRLMVEETHPSGESTETVTYAYDKGNNRVSKTVVGGSEPGTTIYKIGTGSNGSGVNQIQKLTFPDLRTVEFEYDLNGNRVLRKGPENEQESSSSEEKMSVYQYDYENRLVELDHEDDQGATTGQYLYGYDYRTRRVRRTEPGATGLVSVVFSGGVSIEEFGSGGASNPLVEYVRGHDYGGGIGGLQYSVRGDTVRYNQYNGRGDVVGQTNAEGVVKYQTAYEAFGEHPVHVGKTQDRQKTNTKEEDPTGLLNEGFRYRDLLTGTFITRDPAGFIDGPNLYTYVRQNPWTKFDPEGLEADVPKYSFDEALVAASLDIVHYTPGKNEKPPSQVEYRSDIWKDSQTQKYGYTKPYGAQNEIMAGYRDPSRIPANSSFEGLTHNHPSGSSRFSELGNSAVNGSKGDKGSADASQKPIGVVTTGVNGPVIKKYTPAPNSNKPENERKGEVTQYDPKTKKFGPEFAPPQSHAGQPIWIGSNKGDPIYEFPDGTMQTVPKAEKRSFEKQYKINKK